QRVLQLTGVAFPLFSAPAHTVSITLRLRVRYEPGPEIGAPLGCELGDVAAPLHGPQLDATAGRAAAVLRAVRLGAGEGHLEVEVGSAVGEVAAAAVELLPVCDGGQRSGERRAVDVASGVRNGRVCGAMHLEHGDRLGGLTAGDVIPLRSGERD